MSEHGLQAVLYEELRKELSSDSHVVVEPTWKIADGKAFPDLVIVEGEKITDIFELKFVPHYDAEWEDIKKLFCYTENAMSGTRSTLYVWIQRPGNGRRIFQYRRDVGGISS